MRDRCERIERSSRCYLGEWFFRKLKLDVNKLARKSLLGGYSLFWRASSRFYVGLKSFELRVIELL